VSGYQHATACTTSMVKRNADDDLAQVNKILKKYRAQLDQEAEDVDTETEEGEEAPTTKTYIQYSPSSPDKEEGGEDSSES